MRANVPRSAGLLPGCQSPDAPEPPNGDDDEPRVSETLPAPNAVGVSTQAPITVVFNEPVNPGTVGLENFLVTASGGDVAGAIVARTGESGLGAIREVMPDLVICDLGLPGLGGLDVCRRVRESENKKQPTMIALTGWGRADDLRVSKEAGFDFHLVKPVAPASLQELIAKISERSRA